MAIPRDILGLIKTSDPCYMKKIYRQSQMGKILGYSLSGIDMPDYGLKFNNAAGFFGKLYGENATIDLMLATVEKYKPLLHVISFLHDEWVVNRYDENGRSFLLVMGNDDPDIEFSPEFDFNDFSEKTIQSLIDEGILVEFFTENNAS